MVRSLSNSASVVVSLSAVAVAVSYSVGAFSLSSVGTGVVVCRNLGGWRMGGSVVHFRLGGNWASSGVTIFDAVWVSCICNRNVCVLQCEGFHRAEEIRVIEVATRPPPGLRWGRRPGMPIPVSFGC